MTCASILKQIAEFICGGDYMRLQFQTISMMFCNLICNCFYICIIYPQNIVLIFVFVVVVITNFQSLCYPAFIRLLIQLISYHINALVTQNWFKWHSAVFQVVHYASSEADLWKQGLNLLKNNPYFLTCYGDRYILSSLTISYLFILCDISMTCIFFSKLNLFVFTFKSTTAKSQVEVSKTYAICVCSIEHERFACPRFSSIMHSDLSFCFCTVPMAIH